MVIEVVRRRVMYATNIDDASRNVCEVVVGRFTSLNGNAVQMSQQAARQEIVFVGAARMGHYQFDRH